MKVSILYFIFKTCREKTWIQFPGFRLGQTKEAFSATNEPRPEKTNILVSDLSQHKPGCTATEYN